VIDIRYPNLSGNNEQEMIREMRSYLYQLVDQLNVVFLSLESAPKNEVHPTQEVQGEEVSYYELKVLTIKAIEELTAKVDKKLGELGVSAEVGESAGFRYKKWSDGTFEAYGRFSLTLTAETSAKGNVFVSETFSLPMPFDVASAAVHGVGGYCTVVNASVGESITFELLSPVSIASGGAVVTDIFITGIYTEEN